MEFVKAIPPRGSSKVSPRQKQALKLRENPGQWAVIGRYPKAQAQAAYTYASHCRHGRIAAFKPDDGFTVKAQVSESGRHVEVWASWEEAQ